MRRRHGRAAGQPADPRGDREGDHRAREPGAPRRLGRGPDDRRRRRDPDADARRAAARGGRVRAPAARPLRRADVLPADRRGGAPDARRAARADGRAGGPAAARLARRAGLRGAHRACCGRMPPGDPPAVRRRRRGAGIGPGCIRAQAVRDPAHLGAERAPPRPVRRLELLAHRQLQGHADQLPAGRLLLRPARRPLQERARARALALLDQHVPELGARPPLPGDLPQRRDQHRDGQRQLDARTRERAAQRAVRRGPAEDPAGRLGRQLGLGDVRQRARAADARAGAHCHTRR